ncbi:MAG: glycosyltransferase [Nostoc sp.]|uniref:glycosyltransferase n=1 Tax=Nostoc sp. TaxID=1180 RepID=UPI002FF71AB6
MKPADIEKLLSEKIKWQSELEAAFRQLYDTYFSSIDKHILSTEELENDIKDHVYRRYERTLTHYIPWVMNVYDLSDKEVIEIGCGTGSSTAAFSHFSKHIYAYEVENLSVSVAKKRMEFMEINNVSIIQSDPEKLLETLKSNHSSGVSVILLFAVLEHTTIQERLNTLKTCWDMLLPNGILIVAETPNRLTYYDYHTSWLPFFHFLPLDLAVEYYTKSPRTQFKLTVKKHIDIGNIERAKNTLVRWGNAVSYHEFEIVLGSNLKYLLIADGDAEEMRSLYPISNEEKLLQQYFSEANVNQPLAFTNKILNLIFQKERLQNNHTNSFEVSFKQIIKEKLPLAVARIALLVTTEYEGIFRNGGIGTYYRTLSERLAAEDFYVVLLLCQSQVKFGGESTIPALKHIFSTSECMDVLELQPTHLAILSQLQDGEWVDYDSYCALFFAQAIATTFSNVYTYIEFPEMLGLGYRTVQAKRSRVLGENCVVAVTLHSGQEWLQEAHARYTHSHPDWFWQTSHYEQYSFEQADLAFFLSHFLKEKVEKYGWKTSHALHLPYCFSVIEQPLKTITLRNDLQLLVDQDKIPLVFFGRLEERKGLFTFLEAIELLESNVIEKVHIIFLGKNVELQAEGLQGLDSQQYIKQKLGSNDCYTIVTDLFSQEAIQLVSLLRYAVVCLTSSQENFPNTALEMGQLPVSLIVSDTGGFRETLNLIGRTGGVRWFIPENVRSLAQAMIQAISAYPEKFSVPMREFLHFVNQRLLNQRFEYMKQAFYQIATSPASEPRRWILGMTSIDEQLFLENYAQNEYSGRGEIVELGCWFGSSTISLAMGLEANSCITNKNQRIHAYDIFIWCSMAGMQQNLIGTSLEGKYKDGDSFLDEYLERINSWSHLIHVHPGDLAEIGWQQGEIECLFIDAMKSWELTNSIIKNFFPYLIPEVSLVIHQDFAHYYTSWIHLMMYRLREYLVPIEHPFIYSSRAFRYVKLIPNELLYNSYSFDSFSETEVEAAFNYSLEITPKKMQPNILAAKVMHFIHIKNFAKAKLEFKESTAQLDYFEWMELADVQKIAKMYYSIDLLS